MRLREIQAAKTLPRARPVIDPPRQKGLKMDIRITVIARNAEGSIGDPTKWGEHLTKAITMALENSDGPYLEVDSVKIERKIEPPYEHLAST